MKILLLGGTGAMGVHLSELLKQSHEVFITTRKPQSDRDDVTYLVGNARDDKFLTDLLKVRWDAIIDFMVYRTDELKNRLHILLKNTNHYVFLSSARVFANSSSDLIETAPRLLDVSEDTDYLSTDEYALTKARQENLLINSAYDNWTIVRPYITYGENRLQLGVLEKEEWLYRALKGRTIIFCEEMMEKKTTLTYGFDVSQVIANLIGKPEAKKETYNITASISITWGEVLELYVSEILKATGKKPKVILLPFDEFVRVKPGSRHQIIYDRFYDRTFDNSKVRSFKEDWTHPTDGIRTAFRSFVRSPSFLPINWQAEAVKDRYSRQLTPVWQVPGLKNKIKFLITRFK